MEAMNQSRQNILTLIRMMTDLSMVCLAWIVAYDLRFGFGLEVPKGLPERILYLKLIPFVGAIWWGVFTFFGHYRRSNRHRSAILEGLDVIQMSILATLSFIAFTVFYEEYRYSRLTIVFFAIIHPFFLMFGRSLVRKALRFYRRRAAPRRTLVIASGDFLKTAVAMSELGDVAINDIAGVVLVDESSVLKDAQAFCHEKQLPLIESQSDWPNFFVRHPIQTVVIAVSQKNFHWIDENLEKIADQVPDVKILPDLLRYTRLAAGIEIIAGVPIISIHDSPLAGVQGVIKRIVDFIGASLLLFLFSPLMFAIAALVKFSSRGPIFYRQERMGIDGKTFMMLKFRSMPVNAEAASGAVFATASDDRATPIGKFLRRTSLDELPQFINVLSGDMSLVGPRPERPVFVNDFRRKIPGYFLRHKVKAGITGWAQVNGWRGDTSIEKRIECDLYYIQNWSLWLDFKILVMTVFRGFVHHNAY
jgi:Undecaprenyl-phosphate glucose phosphotransferase